jgi:ribonucleoside-diphosphate reductase alpha chain
LPTTWGGIRDGIFSTLRVAALIQQTGGGNGFSFSRLRPKGDVVHTSSGRATGPVGFLRVYDQAFGEIAQGGTRRGANMAVLRVDHPDIEQFITCKAEEGTVTNFNISVAITDEFMLAVKDDTDFDLRSPRDGTVWKTVRARDLFAKMIQLCPSQRRAGHSLHRRGQPLQPRAPSLCTGSDKPVRRAVAWPL